MPSKRSGGPSTDRQQGRVAEFCHIARSQAQSPSGIGIALDRVHSNSVMPMGSNNASRANSSRGRPVALRMMADTSVERAGVVEELLSGRGGHRKTKDITTRIPRHVHARLVVVVVSSISGVASTHFRLIDLVSACTSWMRSFSGERKSDNSGKKLKIGSLTLRISPRSIAIPTASDATLFETDFRLCGILASKVTFSNSPAVNLVGTAEVPLEHQLAYACDQDGMHVARSRELIGHPARPTAIGELVFIDGGHGPAVVTRDRNTTAAGRVRVHRQRGERCQRRSPEK